MASRRTTPKDSPWIDGAHLRPRLPIVVTLHDVVPLKRPGEYLRTGLRFRMRYLAVERATRLIVPTRAVADDALELLKLDEHYVHVVHEAADRAFSPRDDAAGAVGVDDLTAAARRLSR